MKMENKQLLIICAVIIIASCIICVGVYFGLSNQGTNNMTLENNNTNMTNSSNLTVEKSDNTSNNQSTSNSKVGGDNYVYSSQKEGYVKSSGQYDKDSRGNTIHSYQGSDGVIYEEYYDSKGRQISSEEYYM